MTSCESCFERGLPKTKMMKIAILALVGFCLGALVGAIIGVGLGLTWVTVFKTSDFEGYSGMLVFFTFMPIGAIVGGIVGAVLLARAVKR
jgi:hypothetical protein